MSTMNTTNGNKTMKIYSVSYMATARDNGTCASFTSRAAAEKCRVELIAAGCFHVSGVW